MILPIKRQKGKDTESSTRMHTACYTTGQQLKDKIYDVQEE
jgi:hypothetical protein